MKPVDRRGYDLLHNGAIELAQLERNGVRVNLPYLEKTLTESKARIRELEEGMKKDPVWKTWVKRHGQNAKITAPQQLGDILYKDMGYTPTAWTAKTAHMLEHERRPKVDRAALEKIELPFVQDWLQAAKLRKAKGFLESIQRETIEGWFHPMFNLHLASTFRSSSGRDKEEDLSERDTNFQNFPIRDGEMAELVRTCFIADDDDFAIGEFDYGVLEVRVGYCYHKDPTMKTYLLDPTTDMHRDTSMDCFILTRKELGGTAKGMGKQIRYVAKNQMVFPQFYGSYFKQCAPAMWESIDKYKMTTADGTPLKKHLRRHGIKGLGTCIHGEDPESGTFEAHIQEVERKMWGERFVRYAQWKKEWWEEYQRRGWFKTKTGFRVEGIFRRNYVINNPVQGSAFHCDLQALIWIGQWLRKHKMKTKLFGQIHDSILARIHKKEMDDVLHACKYYMTELLPKRWDWIVIPLQIEAEVSPFGGSWHAKRKVAI